MSAHVLLNELGKSDKIRGLLSILSLFYHLTLRFNLLRNHILGKKSSRFCHPLRNVIMDVITLR